MEIKEKSSTATGGSLRRRRATVALHGINFDVSSDVDRAVERLGDYIGPSTRPTAQRWSVDQRRVADLAAVVAARRREASWRGTLVPFRGSSLEHHRRPSARGPIDLFLPAGGGPGPLFEREGTAVVIWTSDDDPDRSAHVLRVVREVAYRSVRSAGGAALHAGGISIGAAGGVLLVGPSGAGKTSALLGAASVPGCRVVANDRVVLTGDPLELLQSPLPIRIGGGTARAVPWLRDFLASGGRLSRPQELTWPEVAAGDADTGWGSDRKVEISPAELVALTGCELLDRSPLAAVVVPDLTPRPFEPRFVPIGRAEVEAVLRAELCSPVDPRWPDPWVAPETSSAAEVARVVERAMSVPAYRLCFGTDWPSALAESWAQFLAG